MKVTGFALLLIVAALAALPSIPGQEGGKGGASKPYVTLWGADSKVKERGYRLIGSQKELEEIWTKHRGEEPSYFAGAPEVDFDRCLVIAVFEGESMNSAGVESKGILDGEKEVTFRFQGRWYQTLGPGGGGKKSTAYGFFVIPRTRKPIVLEENVQNLIGGPPVWKERARLEPKVAKEPSGEKRGE
jgi:hypothetical protein